MDKVMEMIIDNFRAVGHFPPKLGDEKVNDLGNWKDDQGTIHVYVREEGNDYELVDGHWQEAQVF